MKKLLIVALTLCTSYLVKAQGEWGQKFEQLGTMLPTPNSYRTASGAPGKDYWQQKADYDISVELNDNNQSITGTETITYHNLSPDRLSYLWVQLDQNMRAKSSNTPLVTTTAMSDSVSGKALQTMINDADYDGGFKIAYVKDMSDKGLKYTINQTMMRVDLPKALEPGGKVSFKIAWSYNINDRMLEGPRSGYEYFPKDGNYVYTVAQFYPRMAVYDDVNGWQNKQFLGRGEFTLPFGDFTFSVTVPADHILGATGTLQNASQVLTQEQLQRFEKAKTTFDKPVIIVTQKEAEKAEKTKSKEKKTWTFKAENVRDVAFATSRKFIWDAMAVDINGKTPLAMSYYPKEGNPLWEKESTRAVANTLITYSKHTIDYPYPKAISVHAASIGMEYPMICFNFGRPDPDGSYTDQKKWGMIGVIVHEVGHNFFPMIINSDERQWTWMDEGLNTFVQSLTQKEHYPDMPIRRGCAACIVDYMKGDKEGIRPIMTNSEQILQFGNNAYAKPAAALSVLRETIMGPELFDYAFKEYADRWAFKHPSPADFFRTMEDASAMDLDWFWRGWFYTTDHVDVAVDNVKWYKMATNEKGFENQVTASGEVMGADGKKAPATNFQEAAETFVFSGTSDDSYREFMNKVDDEAIKQKHINTNFYELTLKNAGGLVTPVIIEWTYADGTKEKEYIPAEIWRHNEHEVTKVFAKNKEVVNIQLDPDKETADVELDNNVFPRQDVKTRFDQFKEKKN
ncbi:M1 family metallopeptidase [Imperialibacter roseus]|uniref:M1 family metallopeptidase n=1 Tax=Imperialibacter roseus TaxID=1324217 RepID=A0ABZ0IMB8_9BACT|nr:M1 family metallopeptidase [Imperialibacter roseus]WOK06165.1 M1 family metallopeptidase [Imperialibacter roseus]